MGRGREADRRADGGPATARTPILGFSGSVPMAPSHSFPATIHESALMTGENGADIAVIAEIRVRTNVG